MSRDTLSRRADVANFFRCGEAERRPSLATWSVFITLGWCPHVAAPHTDGGALATATPSAASALSARYDLATSLYPHTVRCQEQAQRPPCASECQARGRGSTRQPDPAIASDIRAGADVQATRRAQGQRPLCSGAFATQDMRHDRALSGGSSPGRPVRRRAHPLRYPCSNVGISNAVRRFSMSYTARAN